MFTQGLDHITIWSDDADKTRGFYCDILGLTDGFRPDLGFPGLWLYSGDRAVIHIYLGNGPDSATTGAVDHVAFKGVGDPRALATRLEQAGLPFKAQTVTGGLRQVFCEDPNGVKLEFNFPKEG